MECENQSKRAQSLDIIISTWASGIHIDQTFSPPERFEIFFQLFLGGITEKMIPSENGSILSTSSSSAFPPSVIICRRLMKWSRVSVRTVYLIHLFQLRWNRVKTCHEFIQTRFPQIIVSKLAFVTEIRDLLEIVRSRKELFLPFPVLLQDVQIHLDVLHLLCKTLMSANAIIIALLVDYLQGNQHQLP